MTNAIQRLSDKYRQTKNLGECVYTLELLNTAIAAYKPSDNYNEGIRAAINSIAEMLMNDFRELSFDESLKSFHEKPFERATPIITFHEVIDARKDEEEFDYHQEILGGIQEAHQPCVIPEPIIYGKLNKPKSTVFSINQRVYADKLRQDAIKEKFPSKLAKQLEIGRLGKICEDAGYILELEKIKSRRANGTIQDAFRLHINNATEDWNSSRALSDAKVIDKLQLFINFKNL